jgi:phosphoribosyl-dephospho-CoA transferase
MGPELKPHTLLRLAAHPLADGGGALPPWAQRALRRAPWVVVRRAAVREGLIPVGVRGGTRAERLAAWVNPQDVLECLTPPQLAAGRGWVDHPRRAHVPALAALVAVESILGAGQLSGSWGPCGSVGFELACGAPTATASSDLDLVIGAAQPLSPAAASALLGALSALPVRADVLLELPQGAVALAELARAPASLVLRTPEGPRRIDHLFTAGAAL